MFISKANNRELKKWARITMLCSMFFLLLAACKEEKKAVVFDVKESAHSGLVDSLADDSVLALHNKLTFIKENGFAIGHQDATSYGLGWKHQDKPAIVDSDVKRLVNSYPAVFGFDIGHLELGNTHNLDSVPFETMRTLMLDAHSRGGIITVSWHLDNPVSGGDSWDKTPATEAVLPGGKQHEKFNNWLEKTAIFFKSLKIEGESVPVIFRPYHEMNGGWFWWGLPNSSSKKYIELWNYTVRSLRDQHQVHNLLYAFSPNTLNAGDNYLACYPGDAYVDILGIDVYDFKNNNSYMTAVAENIKVVREIANKKNKLYAFTETGLETISKPNWYSEVLYPQIADSGICWVLFWRNYSTEHHYMPFPGHSSEDDFKTFEKKPETLFLNDINTLLK